MAGENSLLPKSPQEPTTPRRAQQQKVIGSQQLFEGQREVLIVHEGEVYRLRVTRRGKLILQK